MRPTDIERTFELGLFMVLLLVITAPLWFPVWAWMRLTDD